MKRIIGTIAAVAGVGGLIALLSYHPHSDALSSNSGAPQVSADNGSLSNATPNSTPQTTSTSGSGGQYKDGTYTGAAEDVGYGTVQVQAVVSGGRVASINFLQMPFDADRSARIASQAKPILQQEAISAQSADVDMVSGATSDWEGFKASLQAALNQAKG